MNVGPYRVTINDEAADLAKFAAGLVACCIAVSAFVFGIGYVLFVWLPLPPFTPIHTDAAPWFMAVSVNGMVVFAVFSVAVLLFEGAVNIERAES